MTDVPVGFEPLFRRSPFTETIGPLYCRRNGGPMVLGLRVLQKHANARGTAHGGLLMTLADVALGYATAYREDPPAALVTASLTAEFAGSAKVGQWIEAHVDVQKSGARLAFANVYLTVDGDRIMRASAVFMRTEGSLDAPQTSGNGMNLSNRE